jgi:DNA-binding MurR/RpiR family transcriptional regulator
MITKKYAVITEDVIDANISDTAFRVFAWIYVLNISDIHFITDRQLAEILHRSTVTINRAVNELGKNGLLSIKMISNRRHLTVTRTLEKCVVDSTTEKTLFNTEKSGLNPILQKFFEGWPK